MTTIIKKLQDSLDENVSKGTLSENAILGNVEEVRLAVVGGVSPNFREGDALPLLHLAAGHGQSDIVAFLIRSGANVDEDVGFAKASPLHFAVINNHIEVVRLLLANRANSNQTEWKSGNTPLHFACALGNVDIVKLLLDNDADPNISNSIGDLPEHLTENEEIKDLLKKAENNISLFPEEVECELLAIVRKGVNWKASCISEGEIRLNVEGLNTEWGIIINQDKWVSIIHRRQLHTNDKPTTFVNATADFGNPAVTKLLVAALRHVKWD